MFVLVNKVLFVPNVFYLPKSQSTNVKQHFLVPLGYTTHIRASTPGQSPPRGQLPPPDNYPQTTTPPPGTSTPLLGTLIFNSIPRVIIASILFSRINEHESKRYI